MLAVITGVYIVLMSSGAPVYTVYRLDMIFSPVRNKTILGLVASSDRETVEKISLILNNFVLPFTAFAVIVVCTAVISISLSKRTRWRKASTATLPNSVNNRSTKVAKMVVIISALFISCFVPMSVILLFMAIQPGFHIYGKYMNIGTIVGGIATAMESINASANIFIYYHMSIKYRETFNKIFCMHNSKKV